MFLPDLLAGRRILITGGGSGLGAAMATRFAALGASLVLCGRRAEVLDATASTLRATRPASSSQRSTASRSWGTSLGHWFGPTRRR